MGIQICAVGGYEEVGKNMTAVRVDDEVIILDLGIHLENYINYTEDQDLSKIYKEDLISINAVPDDSVIFKWKKMVKAIVPSHAHLDHLAAIPFFADAYDSPPVIATPFSCAVLKAIMRDNKTKIKSKIIELNPNSTYPVTENITLEFINVTHSTPQTVIVALHTKYGILMYACDFKLDNHPGLGKKPNYQRLK